MARYSAKRLSWFIAGMGMLTALSASLSFLEWLLPPVPGLPPGIKLGLANIVVMFTVFYLGWREALILSLLKSVFVLFGRGAAALCMSLAGSLLSVSVMLLAERLWRKNPDRKLISVFGAVSHNIGQLAAAVAVLGTGSFLWYYLPVMIFAGIAMGLVTGFLFQVVSPALERLPLRRSAVLEEERQENSISLN